MRIRGLGVIDDAVLELAPGLTVVTGETGAGKTMVVTGLGLLFGGRADSGAVGARAQGCLVEGRLRVEPGGDVAARAVEAGAELEDDVLLLARSVTAEGRSRAHLGGRAVPAGVLAELADQCLAVHGQSDQSRLRQPARQREALDRYAGAPVLATRERFAEHDRELRSVRREIDELTTRARERRAEADLLRFGLEEIAALDPQPGEDVALAREEDRLAHADALRSAAEIGHAALVGDRDSGGGDQRPDANALVAAARASLDQAGDHDVELATLAARLRDVGYLLADVASELASYLGSVEVDPARLAAVQQRRSALVRLIRKYAGGDAPGGDAATGSGPAHPADGAIDQVLGWSQRAIERLTRLEGDDDRIAALASREQDLVGALESLAERLTEARTAAGERFGAAVTTEMASLAMGQAALDVAVSQLSASEPAAGLMVSGRSLAFGPHGVDDVELLLRPHPGAPARSLAKGASGGELSRVMLAIEVVFAGADPVPTLVFDEVDAGVGGKAAVEVGRRLAMLARTAQVIVVTHLPQVAAFADRHLVVRKASDGAVTRSGVTAVDGADRVQELSRMLAGMEGSETAQAHAAELLQTASASKAAPHRASPRPATVRPRAQTRRLPAVREE